MKIYGDRLAGQLKKKLHRLYILSGDEPLLLQEAGDQVRQAARDAGFSERELFHAEGSFDWGEVGYAVNSGSLFAEKKILEVRMTSSKPDAKKAGQLADAAEQLDDDTMMVLVMPRVEAATQKTKWFKRLDALGLFVQIWPIEARELMRWLDNRFRMAGLKANREAVRMMAQRIEGNLLAAVQEIARLKLVAGDGEVTADMVTGSVADSARYDVFKLIDSALEGHQARVARMVQGLQAEGVNIVFLTTMVARELRALEKMSTALAAGESMQTVLSRARVWKNRTQPVTKCLKRTNPTSLRQYQLSIGHMDRMAKGAEQGDPWQEMTSTLLALAGAPILSGRRFC